MKILITGSCGYIGDYMCDLLTNEGYDITGYDNLLYENHFLKDMKFINGDIRDREKLLKILPNYDVVIWLAGLVGDPCCAAFPDKTCDINLKAVEWFVDNYDGKIIFPSSCSVYGKNDALLDETSPTAPLSIYAATKLAAEEYILKRRQDALIWRLGTLFGQSGQHSRIRLDLVANILTLKAAQGEPLTVFSGSQNRPMLCVKDVAHATLFALRNNISGLFNLTYKNYCLKDMAEEIASHFPNSKVSFSDLPFQDQRNYKVSGEKFYKYGWRPRFTLADGIEEIKALVTNGRIKDPSNPIYSNGSFIKEVDPKFMRSYGNIYNRL